VGADYVSLSGSGGAVYGVFRDPAQAERARLEGRTRDERVHLTHADDSLEAPVEARS
jgi:4-diphosphocytidyl-2C-methyl-D-erythritol kinase